MKIAFITEMAFTGKIPDTHDNMRTEFAWMYALDADHYCINNISNINGYDHIFIIFPKGKLNLSAEGCVIGNQHNPVTNYLSQSIISTLKQSNKNVYYVQEGPTNWFNDYEMNDQIGFYNMLSEVDAIYAHNDHDAKFYKGLLPEIKVNVISTLMIEDNIQNIIPNKTDKVLIGGNFARWYGGFQSYIIANEFDYPIWAQESHAKRNGEDQMPNINHLPRLSWLEWMKQMSTFKYAVHLMPTIAAGTFSLNCAYFGIPCIGNKNVDTQKICHPELCVDVDDVESARNLAIKLRDDIDFYNKCSTTANELYKTHYNIDIWKKKIINTLL
tara:strand:+ start:44 stop:1027 length:984 start_codon:yes stop_codon:yes gene_type:complete